MPVMAREQWTDERLDDLNRKVDQGFSEMRESFAAARVEMRESFAAARVEMREESRALRSEMQALHRTTMVIMFSGFVTMMVGFAGTIATILLTRG
jgi:hypothetical protein